MSSPRKNKRTQKGSMAALLPASVLIAAVGIGAFALDISHNVTVRSELQNATDAGALAGAGDLLMPESENNAVGTALSVAEANTADGNPVSNTTAGTTILTTSDWDSSTNSGTVDMNATVTINNMFSKLFGHATDPVQTHSKARCWRSITGVRPNMAFPLMVSLDTKNGNPKPLYEMNIGDKVDFHLNAQKFKNSAWTGLTLKNTNANWLKDTIDQMLGFEPMEPGHVPSVNVGDSLSLGNGVMAGKRLADGAYESALTDGKTVLVLPVMTGDPPYNQERQCVGFITVHVDSVEKNKSGGDVEVFHCTLLKHVVRGTGGLPESGNPELDNAMKALSAGTVQLIQ